MIADILVEIAWLITGFALVGYAISWLADRNDVADILWGMGFVVIAFYIFQNYHLHPRGKLICLLVVLWGLRLSGYLALRNLQKAEDFRYKKWREEWGHTFWWRSLLQVFLLQGFFLYLIALPLAYAALDGSTLKLVDSILDPFTIGGTLLWAIGFGWQAVADAQLYRFQKNRQPGQILTTGLWALSRHPNYFGEILMWWGIWVISLEWWTIISPITITWLLVRVSGVPMLEAKYRNNTAYAAYVKRTPALLPRWRG
ncbi:MAG: DUF1295 domain-containing protein [Chitinophagaceae bacterium]|nr:DUF1295 domain-containing protein [Chitinophagaceae bacterium]